MYCAVASYIIYNTSCLWATLEKTSLSLFFINALVINVYINGLIAYSACRTAGARDAYWVLPLFIDFKWVRMTLKKNLVFTNIGDCRVYVPVQSIIFWFEKGKIVQGFQLTVKHQLSAYTWTIPSFWTIVNSFTALAIDYCQYNWESIAVHTVDVGSRCSTSWQTTFW